jgi:hypothetical protein
MVNNPLFQNFGNRFVLHRRKDCYQHMWILQNSDAISTYHSIVLFLIDFDYFHDISNGMLSIIRFVA